MRRRKEDGAEDHVVHVQPVPDCLSDDKGFFVVIESWQQRHDNLRAGSVTKAKQVHATGVNRPLTARVREFRQEAQFQGNREL
jgi:hypothetical protein